ncbi:Sorbose reductase sou1 [Coniosporium apollinis]|uniref:Sorbose reductase sou1 n=2 Tax=Coniosporium TaxID=2810619 RepID=A0ABQ9NIX9_9PEZI|nr:Sorbose reductase sou1 [Cladosporium sp. JES 115]KAJ9658818.1 Sorbose reductase sou1 [Coniosporium apollinis]
MSDGAIEKGVFTKNNTQAPKDGRILPLFSLKGKTAIVSGAGAGIGLAVAQGFAEAGADVAIWYNSNKKAIDRASDIEKEYGVKCKAYQVNVTDEASVKKAVNEIVDEFNGRLDIFVANSGIPWTQGPATDGEISHYHKVVSTDLDGTFFCARAAADVWRRQWKEGKDSKGNKLENFTYGSFIATASMSGHIVNIPQLQAAYNAAKAGVIHLCRSLAVEWVKYARANSISPGYMATEISDFIPQETKDIWKSKIPMGREGETVELKGAFLYFASDASTYTTDPHHLLQQIPLTVSPFLSLPTATTLPYTYKSLPSTLPPSSVDAPPTSSTTDPTSRTPRKPQYVVSESGHAAHPDDIIESCRKLQEHLTRMESEARALVQKWQSDIRERDLQEKRRVAPGWLDVQEGERMLVPERTRQDGAEGGGPGTQVKDVMMANEEMTGIRHDASKENREGEELDRAFGGLGLR